MRVAVATLVVRKKLRTISCRSLFKAVLVMQSTQDRPLNHYLMSMKTMAMARKIAALVSRSGMPGPSLECGLPGL